MGGKGRNEKGEIKRDEKKMTGKTKGTESSLIFTVNSPMPKLHLYRHRVTAAQKMLVSKFIKTHTCSTRYVDE